MDDTKLNMLTQYLAMNWALVPLHHVTGMSNGVDPVCSCRMANTCRDAGKHPRLGAWQLEANLVRSVEALHVWPDETNWGVATGPVSGVWALDVDLKGIAAFNLMIEQGLIETTRLHVTGSGGWHLLYALPSPGDFIPTNSRGLLPDGIDVRGKGGYVVLPPSVSGKGAYKISHDRAPAGAAPGLLDLIRPKVMTRVRREVVASHDPDGRWARYARRGVDAKVRELADAQSGRNNLLFPTACRVIELCNAPWAELDLEVEYERWADAGLTHPLGISVPRAEIDGAWRRALAKVGDKQAEPPEDRPWPPRGDVDDLDFLVAPVGSGTATGASGPGDFAPIPSGASAGSAGSPPPTGLSLPEEFWAARPVLQHIRRAAHARVVSGDVLLYSVLARLASLWPHTVRLHSGIGSGASANLYVAVVGPSGAGKTSGVSVARELLPVPHWLAPDDYAEDWPLGTGEGIAESFMGTKRVPVDDKSTDVKTGLPKMHAVRTQVRHNALLHADEGEVLTKMLERAGATIGETLRRGWVGGTVGQANGRAETTRIVKEGKYSLGLVIGFQPETVQPLLADAGAGTPQRFLWAWYRDESIPDTLTAPPGPLTTVWRAAPADPGGTGWIVGDPFSNVDQTPVSFDPAIVAELGAAHRARLRGEEGAMLPVLDAHMPLTLVKVAALLAQLDGRRQVDMEDWRLAKLVWTTSCAVRDHVVELGRQAAGKARAADVGRHAEREGAAEVARAQVREGHYDARVARVARRLATVVAAEKDIPRRELRNKIAQRDRETFEEALDMAVSNGWVARDDAHLIPGPIGL